MRRTTNKLNKSISSPISHRDRTVAAILRGKMAAVFAQGRSCHAAWATRLANDRQRQRSNPSLRSWHASRLAICRQQLSRSSEANAPPPPSPVWPACLSWKHRSSNAKARA